MSKTSRMFNQGALILSALVFVFGAALAVNHFVTLQAIEAQGVIGQAANFDQYQTASEEFQGGAIIALAGFAGMIVFGFGSIVETLKDLGGE